jgi:hypothetical protein
MDEFKLWKSRYRQAIVDGDDRWSLKSIPIQFLDEEMCFLAVSSSWFNLKFVPNKFQSKRVVFTAIRKSDVAMAFVRRHRMEAFRLACATRAPQWVIAGCLNSGLNQEMVDHALQESWRLVKTTGSVRAYVNNPSLKGGA